MTFTKNFLKFWQIDYLPKIITEHQIAFTKSRLIFDNILVAFESLHSMQKHKGKENFMAIKLYMSKAYDRVEWPYLKAIMVKKGFDEQWINLIMLCVTTVSYSVLVHGGAQRHDPSN